MNKEYNWEDFPFESVVIVVEGKSDQQRLALVDSRLQTIATGGSAVSEAVQIELAQLEQTKWLMIFTDPDVQGERIRRILKERLSHPPIDLYLRRHEARSSRNKDKSLGIEHAQLETLREVLWSGMARITTESERQAQTASDLNASDLLALHLVGHPKARRRREALLEALRMGYVNGKHLLERLKWHQVTKGQLIQTLDQLESSDPSLK
ncbi:toprim domain-containing protein [Atopobacter phocae]|uniref:toprim domain-containing protein n=1 Tax=Atopobacter phocae TaxID=136492 RepID=UPI00046F8F9D|nr:DUF4093 domain-containing protein [Atopobacter phocae]